MKEEESSIWKQKETPNETQEQQRRSDIQTYEGINWMKHDIVSMKNSIEYDPNIMLYNQIGHGPRLIGKDIEIGIGRVCVTDSIAMNVYNEINRKKGQSYHVLSHSKESFPFDNRMDNTSPWIDYRESQYKTSYSDTNDDKDDDNPIGSLGIFVDKYIYRINYNQLYYTCHHQYMDPNGIHVDRDDDNQVPYHTFDGKQTIYPSL